MKVSEQIPTFTFHFDEVRNAWRGPETFTTVNYRGAKVIEVDEAFLRELRPELSLSRRYLPVCRSQLCLTRTYAIWYLWPWCKAEYLSSEWFWAVARAGRRLGFIRSIVPLRQRTRKRDLRPTLPWLKRGW